MSPTWRKEDRPELIESRRLQVELAEASALAMALAQRLSGLAAELSQAAAEIDREDRDW